MQAALHVQVIDFLKYKMRAKYFLLHTTVQSAAQYEHGSRHKLTFHTVQSIRCMPNEESEDDYIRPQCPRRRFQVHFLTGTVLSHCSARDYC